MTQVLAQGATEYLVLLAVVLIVALVSVALLGFFPGMASDSQLAQSQAYWQGASPIAITETNAAASTAVRSVPYIRVANRGTYPIRITKVLGGNGQAISAYYNGSADVNISDGYYLAPGEEKHFGTAPTTRWFYIYLETATSTSGHSLAAAASTCALAQPAGTLVVDDFGFEYVAYIEGQQITKRQTGQRLIIRCA